MSCTPTLSSVKLKFCVLFLSPSQLCRCVFVRGQGRTVLRASERATAQVETQERSGGDTTGQQLKTHTMCELRVVFFPSQHEMIHALLFVTERNTVSLYCEAFDLCVCVCVCVCRITMVMVQTSVLTCEGSTVSLEPTSPSTTPSIKR